MNKGFSQHPMDEYVVGKIVSSVNNCLLSEEDVLRKEYDNYYNNLIRTDGGEFCSRFASISRMSEINKELERIKMENSVTESKKYTASDIKAIIDKSTNSLHSGIAKLAADIKGKDKLI